MEFLEKLGINFWLLLGQIVNFLLLLLILSKFVFKPLLNLLDERSKKISKSLQEAEEIKEKLKLADQTYESKVAEAKKEVGEILAKTEAAAETLREQKIKETKTQVLEIIEAGKVALQRQKEQVLKEAQGEMVGLVAAVAAKVLGEKMTTEDDKKLIEKVVGERKK